jgi:UDP-N-acetylmuramyl pentapeptide phosphotransferase/UDP-N-acetylglucosamine-1-phosphate transferase
MREAAAVLLGLLAGAGAVRLLMLCAKDVIAAPTLAKPNYRQKVLPVAGGLLVVLAVVLVEGARVGFGILGVGKRPGLDGTRPLVILACVGFGLLGLLDDLLESGDDHGFSGHVRALARGRVTTGIMKLIGGGALALVIAAAPGPEGRPQLLVDAAVIALAANLGNLLDLRPGRLLKVGLLAWVPLAVVAGGDAVGVALAPVVGACCAVLPDDLGERLMLGDGGANVLGAVLGLGVVLQCAPGTRVVVVGVLLALNAASEWVSFGRVIHRVAWLRRLDELGRRDLD